MVINVVSGINRFLVATSPTEPQRFTDNAQTRTVLANKTVYDSVHYMGTKDF
jgi:hypothetical protein